jgi:hypothetical protein
MKPKEIMDEIVTIKRLAANIEAATDRNDHTGAAALLAEYVGGKFPKLLAAIKAIHDTEGNMPYPVSQYRHSVVKDMLRVVEERDGDVVYELIRAAF